MALSVEDAVNGIFHVQARMARLIAWLLFVLFHTALLCTALVMAWRWQVSPTTARAWVAAATPTWLAGTAGAALGFGGWSALALLAAYAKAWHWLMQRLISHYVLPR